MGILDIMINQSDFLLGLLLEHIKISVLAIFIAVILGLIIGIFLAEYKKHSSYILAIINFLYTIPSISMLGFLIPLTGIGDKTAIIALVIYALLPMVRNTYTGITNVDPQIIEVGTGMGSTKAQLMFKIKLPLAMKTIISGIRNMVTMTIALAGISSFIGAGGLGVAIYRGITTNNQALTITGSLLIAFLALFVDFILGIFEKIILDNKKKNYGVYIALIILILSVLISQIQKEDETIKIASKPMTEQYIITEILGILIEENTDLKVSITQGIGGGTANIHPAMMSGEFDIYPEYTGTAWNAVLNIEGLYNEELFIELQNKYNEEYNMSWVGMYGFNNTYGLAVRKEIAEKYNLVTYSDLARVSNQLIFGAEYDFFGREDGFDDLCNTYNLNFKSTKDMDIGLKYQAINQGEIDIMNIFTTDGMLSEADVVVLIDDMNLYPSYMCGNIIRNDILEENPEIIDILNSIKISDLEIAKMNYDVENLGKTPYEVAVEFLEKSGD